MERISVIWNLTQKCLWNCSFCCVDAKKVKDFKVYNEQKDPCFAFEGELTFAQKKKIIDNMEPDKYRVDFSGGELFLDPMNVELILYASDKFGMENIGVSTSGALITNDVAEKLKNKVKDVEVTVDCIPFEGYKYRPIGYHEYTERGLQILTEHGIHTGVQTVITKENSDYEKLQKLFDWLEANRIDDWSILKFMPVGRGAAFKELCLSNKEYTEVVENIKKITEKTKINICFQYMLPNHEKYTKECRAVKKSIGILPNGNVIACFWALGKNMEVADDAFLLGNAVDNTVSEILENEKSMYWKNDKHVCVICPDK